VLDIVRKRIKGRFRRRGEEEKRRRGEEEKRRRGEEEKRRRGQYKKRLSYSEVTHPSRGIDFTTCNGLRAAFLS
jgi:hypothetical protein